MVRIYVVSAEQELNSCWDGRPFGHNRYGPKVEVGLLYPFPFGDTGSPSNTMCPGPWPTSVPSGILIHPADMTTIDMGRKLGRLLCPSLGESWVPISHNVACAQAYLHTKGHLDPSNRLAEDTNVTDRQDRRQRSDRANRLINGRQKTHLSEPSSSGVAKLTGTNPRFACVAGRETW